MWILGDPDSLPNLREPAVGAQPCVIVVAAYDPSKLLREARTARTRMPRAALGMIAGLVAMGAAFAATLMAILMFRR